MHSRADRSNTTTYSLYSTGTTAGPVKLLVNDKDDNLSSRNFEQQKLYIKYTARHSLTYRTYIII